MNLSQYDLTRMQQFLRRLQLTEFFTFNSLFSTPAVPYRYFHFHIFIVLIIECIGLLAFIFYKQSSFNRPWCMSCGSSCGLPSCSARCWLQRFSMTLGLCRSSIVILSLLLQKWSDVPHGAVDLYTKHPCLRQPIVTYRPAGCYRQLAGLLGARLNIQGGPNKTADGFLCYNFAYSQSFFIIFGTCTL